MLDGLRYVEIFTGRRLEFIEKAVREIELEINRRGQRAPFRLTPLIVTTRRLLGVSEESDRLAFPRTDVSGLPSDHEGAKGGGLCVAADVLGDRLRGEVSSLTQSYLGLCEKDRLGLPDLICRS